MQNKVISLCGVVKWRGREGGLVPSVSLYEGVSPVWQAVWGPVISNGGPAC